MVHSTIIRDTYNPLESTVHISHIAQHAVAGERHAFRVSSLQLEVSSYLPVISSAAERSREILSCRSIAKREKISHRLHRFSQKFQSDDGLCSQASGLHGTAKRSCHAETAETAETPVISSAAERSREILSCRSIAKRKKSHTDYTDFHRFLSPPPN